MPVSAPVRLKPCNGCDEKVAESETLWLLLQTLTYKVCLLGVAVVTPVYEFPEFPYPEEYNLSDTELPDGQVVRSLS